MTIIGLNKNKKVLGEFNSDGLDEDSNTYLKSIRTKKELGYDRMYAFIESFFPGTFSDSQYGHRVKRELMVGHNAVHMVMATGGSTSINSI